MASDKAACLCHSNSCYIYRSSSSTPFWGHQHPQTGLHNLDIQTESRLTSTEPLPSLPQLYVHIVSVRSEHTTTWSNPKIRPSKNVCLTASRSHLCSNFRPRFEPRFIGSLSLQIGTSSSLNLTVSQRLLYYQSVSLYVPKHTCCSIAKPSSPAPYTITIVHRRCSNVARPVGAFSSPTSTCTSIWSETLRLVVKAGTGRTWSNGTTFATRRSVAVSDLHLRIPPSSPW